MRRFVSGEAARLYCETTRKLHLALETGAITVDEYQGRLVAINDWLSERRVCVLPDRGCGYGFFRNPSA